MARPADISPLATRVEIGTDTGTQLQTHFDFLESIVNQAEAYNEFQNALGIEVGSPLDSGFLRVGDDGASATTTIDTPRSFNGVTAPFNIRDGSNA